MPVTQITDVLTSRFKQIVNLPAAKPQHVHILETLKLPEVIDDLRDLEISFTEDESHFEIEASWRVSKDGGIVKALWTKNSNPGLSANIRYQLSEADCALAFGSAGDYSCSNYSETICESGWSETFPSAVEKVDKYLSKREWVN